jgi:hypothetical protein
MRGISPQAIKWTWLVHHLGVDRADELAFEMHFATDLSDGNLLATLQEVLVHRAPRVAETLEVHAFERDPTRIRVDCGQPGALLEAIRSKGLHRGATFQALSDSSPPAKHPREFGSALLRGRGPGTSGVELSVGFDAYVPAMPMGDKWLWSNNVRASVSVAKVNGTIAAEWITEMLRDLAGHPSLLWGAAYVDKEFRASNLHDGPDGTWAIGRDVRRHLPGVFWLNVFGKPYLDLIGEDNLHAAAAVADVDSIDGNAFIRAYADPARWNEAADQRKRLRAALGDDLFFDRAAPERPTRAPDFGLHELPKPTQTLSVLATDGDTFTVLP